MNSVLISIALATFNGARFLGEQLESYLAQERLPDELVVGDDGSSDGTLDLLRSFASSAPFPVRILDGPSSGGIASNFERTIAACAGDLILLSDQDDIWFSSKIAVVERAMAAAPDMLALHHDEWVFDNATGARLPLTMSTRLRKQNSWEHVLYAGNCSALRRALLPIVLPILPGLGYDEWLSLLPERLGARLILDEPLQSWRRHGSNSSTPVAAEARPPTPLAMARRFGTGDPRAGWALERAKLAFVAERIAATAAKVDALLGPGRAERAIQSLEQSIAGIEQRSERLGLATWRRWASVAAALARGEYRQFAGWRSAAKDAVRRP